MKKFYILLITILIAQFSIAQKVSVPELVAPANELVDAMPNVTLDWNPVTGVGAISYTLQLATDNGFSNLVVDEDGIEVSAYFNENLLFGQTYFWRVKATDDLGTSGWSATNSFTVFSHVVLSDPGDEDDEVDIRPMMEWKNKVDGTTITGGFTGFQVEFDTTNTFDSPLYHMMTSDGVEFERIIDYLLFETVYYWRVRPYHATSVGEWSDIWWFETIFGTELKKPNNNSTNQEFDVELTWKEVKSNKGVIEYTIEVSTDENFTTPVTLITTETEVAPEFLKFGTQYWWRARAGHVNDVSVWTDARTFSTISTIDLSAPANNEVVNDTRPTLEWEPVASVDGYQIIFSKSADYSNPTYYIVPGEDSDSYPLTTLDKDQDYYWSVRAFRSADTSAWAEQYHFNIPYNVGINELNIVEELNIYPNPATTNISVSFNVKQATELTWIITDVLGQNISEETMSVHTGLFTREISIADLNKGIYFLEIKQGDQKKVTKFIVK